MIEQFKLISNYDNYMVSNFGSVWNSKTNEILKMHMNKHNYIFVYLYNNQSKRTIKFIHHLVLQEFINISDHKPFIHHIDGNFMNNHLTNLQFTDVEIKTICIKPLESFNISF